MAASLDIRLKWLILVALVGGAVQRAALAPFIMWPVRHLLNPVVLERRGVGHSLGVSLVFSS
jgi:hypothetical protein